MNFEYEDSVDNIHNYLKSVSRNDNIIEELRRYLTCWNYKSTRLISSFKEDIEQVVDELIDAIFVNNREEKIYSFIWSFVHSEIYDYTSSLIKKQFAKEDLDLYNISRKFCKNNGRPNQFGATVYNFIPNAAVVELSMLNSKRTPLEKLNCLSSAYDYIFAEVKGALISVISKYSDKEIDLPSINNKEVIPIVAAVVLKSRLFYFISDMYYISHLGSQILNENKHLSEIYRVFEESLNKILSNSPPAESPEACSEKLDDSLSVCHTIEFIEKVTSNNTNNQTVFEEEINRVANLITSATTEDLEQLPT